MKRSIITFASLLISTISFACLGAPGGDGEVRASDSIVTAASVDDRLCRLGTDDCSGSADGSCCVPNVGGRCEGGSCGHCSVPQAGGLCWTSFVAQVQTGAR